MSQSTGTVGGQGDHLSSYHTSLRCLSHPLALTSLALLLLNDHWLKQAAPSALTGKLSDFAGLFFFPFLLSALLGLALSRWRVAPRRIAGLGFVASLLWFTAIKTLPFANFVTSRLAGLPAGGPVQIVRDPSDLMALLSLLPAWLLYLHEERQPLRRAPGRLAYLALGVAVLASLATSPGLPRYFDRFVPVEGGLLLANGPLISADMPKTLDTNTFAFSTDGMVWQAYTAVTPEQWQAAQAAPVLPRQVCRTQQPLECYRITGGPQVERSTDGGATWQVDWQFPVERLTYMSHRFQVSPAILNINPLDLAMLELPDGPRVVAAMGDQGALVRQPSGVWQRLPVLYAAPTATQANDPMEAVGHLIIEIIVLLGVALLGIVILSAISWAVVLGGSADKAKRAWALRPLWLVAAGLLVAYAASRLLASDITAVSLAAFILFSGLILAGLIWTGSRVSRLAGRPAAMRGLVSIASLGPLAAASGALVVFFLWAFAVIPAYNTALLLALVLGGSILLISLAATVLLARQAGKAQTG